TIIMSTEGSSSKGGSKKGTKKLEEIGMSIGGSNSVYDDNVVDVCDDNKEGEEEEEDK
ncbi:22434_t:CDS:2, partial [Entrophospora sp. SA101]